MRVVIPHVPIQFLLALDDHVQELVRELLLFDSDERHPARAALLSLRDLLDDYELARHEARKQAETALADGDRSFRLEVDLPAEAASAAREFMALLEDLDRGAAAGRLLTLPATPEIWAFARTYLDEIIRQVAGGAGPQEPFGHVGREPQTQDRSLVGVPRGAAGSILPRQRHEVRLAATAVAPRKARHAVRSCLTAWGILDLSDQVELVVSELVTNAFLHGGREMGLEVLLGQREVRVEVVDPVPTPPAPQMRTKMAGTGRGLMVLDVLASSWGVEPSGTGKKVWVSFALPRPSVPAESRPAEPASSGPAGPDRSGTHASGDRRPLGNPGTGSPQATSNGYERDRVCALSA